MSVIKDLLPRSENLGLQERKRLSGRERGNFITKEKIFELKLEEKIAVAQPERREKLSTFLI